MIHPDQSAVDWTITQITEERINKFVSNSTLKLKPYRQVIAKSVPVNKYRSTLKYRLGAFKQMGG